VDNFLVTNSKVVDDALGIGREVDSGEVGEHFILEEHIVNNIHGISVDGNSVVRLALVDLASDELVVSNSVLRKRSIVVKFRRSVTLIAECPVLGDNTLVLLDSLHGDKTKVVVGVEIHVAVDLNDVREGLGRNRSVTVLHNTGNTRGDSSHTEVAAVASRVVKSVGREGLVLSGNGSDIAPAVLGSGRDVEGDESHGNVLVIVLDNTKKAHTKNPLNDIGLTFEDGAGELSGSKVVLAGIVDATNSGRNNSIFIVEDNNTADDATDNHIVSGSVHTLEVRGSEESLSRIVGLAEDNLLVNSHTVGEPLRVGEVETLISKVANGRLFAGDSRENNKSKKEERAHDHVINKNTP